MPLTPGVVNRAFALTTYRFILVPVIHGQGFT